MIVGGDGRQRFFTCRTTPAKSGRLGRGCSVCSMRDGDGRSSISRFHAPGLLAHDVEETIRAFSSITRRALQCFDETGSEAGGVRNSWLALAMKSVPHPLRQRTFSSRAATDRRRGHGQRVDRRDIDLVIMHEQPAFSRSPSRARRPAGRGRRRRARRAHAGQRQRLLDLRRRRVGPATVRWRENARLTIDDDGGIAQR